MFVAVGGGTGPGARPIPEDDGQRTSIQQRGGRPSSELAGQPGLGRGGPRLSRDAVVSDSAGDLAAQGAEQRPIGPQVLIQPAYLPLTIAFSVDYSLDVADTVASTQLLARVLLSAAIFTAGIRTIVCIYSWLFDVTVLPFVQNGRPFDTSFAFNSIFVWKFLPVLVAVCKYSGPRALLYIGRCNLTLSFSPRLTW